LNVRTPKGPFNGFPLSSFAVEVEQDLVSLRRRTRKAAEEFGLDERTIRSLSTAVYEAGRLLFSVAGRAHVSLSLIENVSGPVAGGGPFGPALELTLATSSGNLDAARRALHSSVENLRGMVPRVSIADTAMGVAVSLAVPLPPEHTGGGIPPKPGEEAAYAEESPAPDSGWSGGDASDVARENESLRRSVRELQSELQETNRGVVAVYAELHDQAERLRQAEAKLRVLLDSVRDYAICMLDPAGEIATWNSGAERLFGYAPEHIIGRGVGSFYTPADVGLGLPEQHLRAALEHGRSESEGLRVRQGGSAFDAHVVLAPARDSDGALRGFSLVVHDVTERKRLEDDLRQRAQDLAAANRSKEEFLATLSHELRTPLNAMLGWTRLLRMGKLDPAAHARALETIERNARIQEQLIADILDVSRIVTGKLRVELRPLTLAPIVDAALDSVRFAAEAKGIDVSCDVQFTGTVLGDSDRLQQVLWNLLANAIKFTPPGGRVQVTLTRVGPQAVLTVTDTGEGMPADLVPIVFDRFTQGDASVTRPHGGLGLGLSIVRHIVESHGGDVQAESEGPGQGSTFVVRLPVRAIQHAALVDHAATESPLAGLKVLVVDDDADAREVVSLALATCGARTAAAGSAREALTILPEFRPDVLVSDIGMPGEDGYALIRRVRALGGAGLADVPAIALTGFAHADNRQRALMAGFQQFVPKPVQADELAEVVRALAGKRLP
jgi:PAS domain S-box-containing protein